MKTRRSFIKTLCAASVAMSYSSISEGCKAAKIEGADKDLFFKISLAEWSLHRALFSGKMTNLDFPVVAKRDYGITAVEYVNQFFMDKAKDMSYLKELKMRCDDNGVFSHLIMCDGEGDLGDPDTAKRKTAVENHYKWVEAAKFLGCRHIRVNAFGEGTSEAVAKASVESLHALSSFAKPFDINVIVENHGGYSSQEDWLADVIKKVGMKSCGILPDFGNFCIRYQGERWKTPCAEWGDRYKITEQYMPYALGMSAKVYDFDAKGECVETDYRRMLKIVKDGGYKGYIGVEYEGDGMSEEEGIRATLALLRKVGAELSR